MKKLIIFIIFLVFLINMQSQQLPNLSFELWDSSAGYSEPVDWTTPNPTSYVFPFYVLTVTPSAESYSGAQSARLETKEIVGIPVPGLLTLGELHVDVFNNTSTITGGIPFQYRPEKLFGHLKYFPQANDSALIGVFMLKHNSVNGSLDTIGIGSYYQSVTASNFTEFEISIDYSSSEIPDSANIIIISSDVDNPVVGSILFIDDLYFDYSSGSDRNILKNDLIIINPVGDYLKIINTGEKINSVKIYSLSGILVLYKEISLSSDNMNLDIILSGINSGQYILEIEGIRKTRQYKILKF